MCNWSVVLCGKWWWWWCVRSSYLKKRINQIANLVRRVPFLYAATYLCLTAQKWRLGKMCYSSAKLARAVCCCCNVTQLLHLSVVFALFLLPQHFVVLYGFFAPFTSAKIFFFLFYLLLLLLLCIFLCVSPCCILSAAWQRTNICAAYNSFNWPVEICNICSKTSPNRFFFFCFLHDTFIYLLHFLFLFLLFTYRCQLFTFSCAPFVRVLSLFFLCA